ncbi:MAG TPA: hypothetical protein VI076_10570 [Actinopolymorphaceae bacterium]
MPNRRPRFAWHDDVERHDLASFDHRTLALLRARAEVVHRRPNPSVGRIREASIPDDDRRIIVLYVECLGCPGIGVLFVRIVPRDAATPDQAFDIARARLREMPAW